MLVMFLFVLGGLSAGTCAIADSSAGHVYLSGCVHKEGAVDIPEGGSLTVTQAIILGGGLSDSADPHHVKILRKKADGTSQVIVVDWIEIVGGGPPDHPVKAHLEKDVAVQQGRLSKFREQAMAVKTNQEYHAIQHEMAFAQAEIKNLEDKVDKTHFLKVHRSYIVNLERVTKIEPYSKDNYVVVLGSGQQLPVSRSGYARLRAFLDQKAQAGPPR